MQGSAFPQQDQGDPTAQSSAGSQEARSAERFKLMMRAAKLAGSSAETACIIRDVSATGVRLKVFHDLPIEDRFAIELANGDIYYAQKMWERDGEAGFQFIEPIDVNKFLAEASPFPKRQLRLRTQLAGMLFSEDIGTSILIRDLSQQGASIESERRLSLNQPVRIEADGLPNLMATIRWRSHPNYGVSFQNFFRMDELARLSWAVRPNPDAGADDTSG